MSFCASKYERSREYTVSLNAGVVSSSAVSVSDHRAQVPERYVDSATAFDVRPAALTVSPCRTASAWAAW